MTYNVSSGTLSLYTTVPLTFTHHLMFYIVYGTNGCGLSAV